jgi:uncharacterized protein
MRLIAAVIATLLPAPVLAQEQPEPAPSIQVVGTATVSTKPDTANLLYWVTGEGKTADEASTQLAAKHKAISEGLAGLLGGGTRLSSGEVIVIETREPACDGAANYNSRPRLSTGACAVTGYLARLQGTVRTDAVEKAGTAAGLAARLGASDARLQGFFLRDTEAAQRRATAAAIADARAKAEAMAAGAGVRLGSLITLNDQNSSGEPIVVEGRKFGESRNLAVAPPPVSIDVSPSPIETRARVHARYAIAR